MCEMLAASFPEARPFAELAGIVAGLEEYGLGSFGWGVAWLEDGAVRGIRGLGRFRDEGIADENLLTTRSRRFLVHLRRPSRLSTIQMADTQPFFEGTESAWCHNGFLDRAAELRHEFEGELRGQADSEVGWRFFLARLAEGLDACSALRNVGETFGGKANLGFLSASGELALYSQNASNRMWRFSIDEADFATTDLHSDDNSVFDLVVPKARARQRVEPGTAFLLAPAD
jgi:predicted glutamine amidotransferase